MSTRRSVGLSAAGGLLWSCSELLAASVGSAPIPDLAPSPLSSVLRVISAFALVMAVFGAIIWSLKNWQRISLQKSGPQRLQVLEAKSLGQRQALYVVGYDDQRFLMSASSTGVTLLTQLPPCTQAPETPTSSGPDLGWNSVFERVLNSCRRKSSCSGILNTTVAE
jgi:flagellar biogenesis protein FliO